jgi:hypothetical protein
VSPIQEEVKSQEKPVYCLGGLRQRGGVTLIQALVRNVGNCALMRREKLKSAKADESESTEAKHRGGLTHSSGEISVMERERRSQIICETDWSTSNGRNQ